MAAAALLALMTAACGSSSAASSLPTSMPSLVDQAKSEGEVDWAAPKSLAEMQPAIDLFQQKYPGIKVKYSSTLAADQVNQLKGEQAARKVTIDVADAGGLTIVPADGMAQAINWPAYGIPSEDVLHNNFIYIWATPKVWAYNTNAVSPSALPKTWDELLQPQWANGTVSADSAGAFMTPWYTDPSMGTDKAVDWAQKFTAQHPHFATGVNQTHSLVSSGQVKLGTSLTNLVLNDEAKGAPIKVAPVSPTTANESYLFVPKGAPHPAAAVLLSSFLSSDEAQAVLAKSYNSRIPTTTDCSGAAQQNKVVKTLCDAGVKWYPSGEFDQYKGLSSFFDSVTKALGTNLK